MFVNLTRCEPLAAHHGGPAAGLGTEPRTAPTSARFVRSHRKIAERYFKSWFCVDFVTCIPYDLMGIFKATKNHYAGTAPEAVTLQSGLEKLRGQY